MIAIGLIVRSIKHKLSRRRAQVACLPDPPGSRGHADVISGKGIKRLGHVAVTQPRGVSAAMLAGAPPGGCGRAARPGTPTVSRSTLTQIAAIASRMAGSVDVDAITLSMADAADGTDGFARATVAIVIAAVANTAVKCGAVLALGTGRVRVHVGIATAALLAASLLALTFV